MRTASFTDARAKKLPKPAGHRLSIIYYDGSVPAFGLRVTKAEARSWVLNYRVHGLVRRLTIGSLKVWNTEEARREARRLCQLVDQGLDPLQARQDARDLPTMADLADKYIQLHLPTKRPTSQRDDKRMLKNIILPTLGRRCVTDVSTEQVEALLRKVSAKAPVSANRVRALLSTLFSLAIKWKMCAINPVKGIPRNPEVKRKRYLESDELARLFAALRELPAEQSADVVRLLLLTGARRGETLSATWDQFDLAKGIWTKPAGATKQKTTHAVPLNAQALTMLSEMAKIRDSDLLFPHSSANVLTHFWMRLCKKAAIEGVRVHDLRHSYASILVSQGFSLELIGALLGHTSATTTSRYAHMMPNALREAVDSVGATLARAGGDKSGVIVPLGKRRG